MCCKLNLQENITRCYTAKLERSEKRNEFLDSLIQIIMISTFTDWLQSHKVISCKMYKFITILL